MRGTTVLLGDDCGRDFPAAGCSRRARRARRLRCEGLADPLGIDRAEPRLSWAIPPGEPRACRRQHTRSRGRFLGRAGRRPRQPWDSGKVESDQSQWVAYAGQPLAKGSLVVEGPRVGPGR